MIRRIKLELDSGNLRALFTDGPGYIVYDGSHVISTDLDRSSEDFSALLVKAVEFWSKGA